MDDQTEFDPYDLLEIPPEFRPPTLYQLLGVDDFEDDLEAISEAAKQRNHYLHQIAAGSHRKAVQDLLSEVAVARRTLLKEEAKQAYDAELMSLLEEDEPEPTSAIRVVTEPKDASSKKRKSKKTHKTGQADDEKARTRRRKKSAWDEWKLHLASASVLLTIVGIVWFVNRGGGERRAAKAGAVKQTTPARRANAARPSDTNTATTKKRRPLPKFRPGGPKLPTIEGFDLNINTPEMAKPGEAEPAKKEDKPAAAKEKKPEPKKVAKPTPTKQKPSAATKWFAGLKVIDDFSKPLEERYKIQQKGKLKIQNGRLVILPSDKKAAVYPNLEHKTQKFSPGSAVAFTTNLRETKQSIGVSVDTLRFLFTPHKKKLEFRVRDQSTEKMKVLTTFDPGDAPNATLLVHRPEGRNDFFNWVCLVGDKPKMGRFRHKLTNESPKLKFVFGTPPKGTKPLAWVDNLRFGKPAGQLFQSIKSAPQKF